MTTHDDDDDTTVWEAGQLVAWDISRQQGEAALASGARVPVCVVQQTGGWTSTLHSGMAIEARLSGNQVLAFRQARTPAARG